MPSLIAELLQGLPESPKDLYKALKESGKKNRNRNGGLGSEFRAETRIDLVDNAFHVDDSNHPFIAIKSLKYLYALAQLFKAGGYAHRSRESQMPANPLVAAISLSTFTLQDLEWESTRQGQIPLLIEKDKHFYLYGNTNGKKWKLTRLSGETIRTAIPKIEFPCLVPLTLYPKIAENIQTKAAHRFDYTSEYVNVSQNQNKYAICLALIFYYQHYHLKLASQSDAIDLRHTLTALQELNAIFANGHLSDIDTQYSMKLSALINLKLKSHQQILHTSIVESSRIEGASVSEFINSVHSVQNVFVSRDSNEAAAASSSAIAMRPSREFIRKREVSADVAGLEVFSGTMMELYNGPHQPTTLQEINGISDKVSILSEKTPFQPFSSHHVSDQNVKTYNHQTLEEWADDGFPDAAVLDVASLHLAENDYHNHNGGRRKDTKQAIRIDFDNTLTPINPHLIPANEKAIIQCQRIDGEIYSTGIKRVDAFAIHSADLTDLPILRIAYDPSQHLPGYFLPFNWWAHSYEIAPTLRNKILALQVQKNYQYEKFRSMLEKIIMPFDIIKNIADISIFNLKQKRETLAWMQERQNQMQAAAILVPGYIEFLQQHGAAARDELKQRYQKFVDKRTDLHFPNSPKQLFRLYDENYENYINSLPQPAASSAPILENDNHLAQQAALGMAASSQVRSFMIDTPDAWHMDPEIPVLSDITVHATDLASLASFDNNSSMDNHDSLQPRSPYLTPPSQPQNNDNVLQPSAMQEQKAQSSHAQTLSILSVNRNLAVERLRTPSLHAPSTHLPPQPGVNEVNAAYANVHSMLNTIREVNDLPVETQKRFFLSEIKKFNLDELKYLTRYMHQVQRGYINPHPFDAIRLQQGSCTTRDKTTNTKAWKTLRHEVKMQIIQKLRESYPNTLTIQLSKSEYNEYYHLLNQHTGRAIGRLFCTSSVTVFKNHFNKAPEELEPTLESGYRRPFK